MSETLLRQVDVSKRTGLGRSAIYKAMEENRFPQPVKIGLRAVGWVESEIEAWIQETIGVRDAQ